MHAQAFSNWQRCQKSWNPQRGLPRTIPLHHIQWRPCLYLSEVKGLSNHEKNNWRPGGRTIIFPKILIIGFVETLLIEYKPVSIDFTQKPTSTISPISDCFPVVASSKDFCSASLTQKKLWQLQKCLKAITECTLISVNPRWTSDG